MGLLVSKRVRKNFTGQVFGNGAALHGPLIICFAKNDVMMPGQYASFLGREFSHHDYLNTVINWSLNDGAGGSNRQYFLGFAYVPQGSATNFYSDENGCYFTGPLPINVISEGTIGSMFIMSTELVTGELWIDEPSVVPTIPSTGNSIAQHYVAIPEGTSSTTFFNTPTWNGGSIDRSSSGFDGTNYVYRASGQKNCEVYGYNKLLLVTDSVGVEDGSCCSVSSMYVSASTTTYVNSIKIKVGGVW